MRKPTRRAVLGAGIAAAGGGLLTACSTSPTSDSATSRSALTGPDGYVSPGGKEAAATEARRKPGPPRRVRLTAVETRLDLGGRTVRSWAYGDRLPGQEIRVNAGDTLALTFANHLPEATSVHWHGLALS